MAKLKARINALTDVEEGLRGLYVEANGKFVLNVEPVDGFTLEDTTGLKSSLSKERESAREALAKLAEFGEMSPREARDALIKIKDASSWSSDTKVAEKMEALKKQLTEAHAQELKSLNTKTQSLTKQLEGALIDSVGAQACVKHKGDPFFLMDKIKAEARIRENPNGEYVVEVLDAQKNPRIKDGQGNLMTIEDLVGEMATRESYARAFEGANASGGGSVGGNGVTSGSEIRLSEAQARNVETYQSARAEAEKTGKTLVITE